MVCIYCGSNTRVINSRWQKRSNQVWRRRKCLVCQLIMTTHEAVELESALTVGKNGRMGPFLPDLLLEELLTDLRHRPDVYTASREVLSMIVKRLLTLPHKPVFETKDITDATVAVLKNFDRQAYLRYTAEHSVKLNR